MIVENLFPTPIGFFKYKNKLTVKENKFLLNQKTRVNQGNKCSINNRVLDDKNISKLKAFINNSLFKYFEDIYATNSKVEPYVTQSWLNYTKENEFHHRHNHSNSFISGVFYVQATSKKDKIYFFKDKYEQLTLSTVSYNPYNSSSWWFKVETNDLIIFPSNLTHEVANVVGKERISLSFNTFLQGNLGVNESLTGLNLQRR